MNVGAMDRKHEWSHLAFDVLCAVQQPGYLMVRDESSGVAQPSCMGHVSRTCGASLGEPAPTFGEAEGRGRSSTSMSLTLGLSV